MKLSISASAITGHVIPRMRKSTCPRGMAWRFVGLWRNHSNSIINVTRQLSLLSFRRYSCSHNLMEPSTTTSESHTDTPPTADHAHQQDVPPTSSYRVSPLSVDSEGNEDKFTYSIRGFTSEIFKLELLNLPPYVGFRQLRTRLKSLNLNPVKIKINPTFCFVTFRSEEEKQVYLMIIVHQPNVISYVILYI